MRTLIKELKKKNYKIENGNGPAFTNLQRVAAYKLWNGTREKNKMGQIANQKVIELFFKMKRKIKEEKEKKRIKGEDKQSEW